MNKSITNIVQLAQVHVQMYIFGFVISGERDVYWCSCVYLYLNLGTVSGKESSFCGCGKAFNMICE